MWAARWTRSECDPVSLTVSMLRLARRVTDAFGVDIGTDLAPLIATARPPRIGTAGLSVRRNDLGHSARRLGSVFAERAVTAKSQLISRSEFTFDAMPR